MDDWYDLYKDEIKKIQIFLMKNHKPTSFTLSHITFNLIIVLRWNFAWSLMTCWTTMV
jgi:hypothetical protein